MPLLCRYYCHTVHEFRKIYGEVAFLRVAVGENAIVWQCPAEGIRDDHNDAFWRAIGGVSDVTIQTVNFLNTPRWRPRMKGASGTTHLGGHREVRTLAIQFGRGVVKGVIGLTSASSVLYQPWCHCGRIPLARDL